MANAMRKRLSLIIPVLLAAVILAFLIVPNFKEMSAVLRNTQPLWLAVSLLMVAGSYVFMSLMLWDALILLNYRLKFIPTAAITLVSTVVNYFVSSAGASGFITRVHLLEKRGVPYGACVTSSIVITVLIYVSLAAIVAGGLVLRFVQTPSFGRTFWEGLIGICAVLGIATALVVIFFNEKIRKRWGRKIFLITNKIVYFFSKRRLIPYEQFKSFQEQLDSGIDLVYEHTEHMPRMVAYVFADWFCNMFVLYFAFKAVGVSMAMPQLIIGFAIGMLMTVIPILPGGMGAMEAAMTASFVSMGLDKGAAIAASLIFRILYYILPGFLSLFVFWWLKTSERRNYN